jgi:hypothetical protein
MDYSVPLSPRAEKQMVTKPTKFKNLVGFCFLGYIKLFIKSQSLGVFQGVTKKLNFK